jgi:hypothetical protein
MPAWVTTIIVGALVGAMLVIFLSYSAGCSTNAPPATRTTPAIEQVQHDVAAARAKLQQAIPQIDREAPKTLVREADTDLARATTAAGQARTAAAADARQVQRQAEEIERLRNDGTARWLARVGAVAIALGTVAVAVGIWLRLAVMWQAGALTAGVGLALLWLARNLALLMWGMTGAAVLVIVWLVWRYRALWLGASAVVKSIDVARKQGAVAWNADAAAILDREQGVKGKALVDAVQGKRRATVGK